MASPISKFFFALKQIVLKHYNYTGVKRTDEQIERERYLLGNIPFVPTGWGPMFNRWLLVPAAVLIQLSVGSLYAWSTFNIPLDVQILGSDQQMAPNVFFLAVAMFGLSAATLGPWLERHGPFKAVLLGSFLFFLGHVLAGIGAHSKQYALVFFGYGVVAGPGFGITYIAPVSPLQKWFPDIRGMAAGFAVCGFGGGTLAASYLFKNLIIVQGVGNTFIIASAIYYFIMVVCAPILRVPPPGYAVGNMTVEMIKGEEKLNVSTEVVTMDSATGSAVNTTPEEKKKEEAVNAPTSFASVFSSRDLVDHLLSREYLLMWIMMLGNSITGLLIISRLSNMVQTMFGKTADDGANMVAINSGVNMFGRLVFSMLSDRLGRKASFLFTIAAQAVGIGAILVTLHKGSYQGFLISVFVTGMCYGAGFGVIPAFLADMFGAKNVGATHGIILTAWAFTGAVLGPIFNEVLKREISRIGSKSDPSVYDNDFYWVLGIVFCAWISTWFIRTNLRDRFLPKKAGEWTRFRIGNSWLFSIGCHGIRRISQAESDEEWSTFMASLPQNAPALK